jgi:alkanesulfonate monooxygenase SsuD/methylene tetrahydromethanopterin reductase-like flavin-dependent oxidoreductase (luciferase family)
VTGPAPLLAVALDGAGHHPAAGRVAGPGADGPFDPFDAGAWARAAALADRAPLDLVTIEDTFGAARARPDAGLVAARVAPLTRRVGLVPVVTTTHTEPFHVASALSTLDHISRGRAGWQPRISARAVEADLVGARPAPTADEAFADAVDAVEAVRRLWDSWEDDAIIKDLATGRYVDRDKLHYVDFAGGTFTVKGPSIVPRPPQGQPVVAVLAHVPPADDLAARGADLVFVTPEPEAGAVRRRVDEVRAAEAAAGRAGEPLRVVADLAVVLDATAAGATARRDRLDELAGAEWHTYAALCAGAPGDLADLLAAGPGWGLAGWRLRPAVTDHDLPLVAGEIAAALRPRTTGADDGAARTLRARLGLPRPASRYAGSGP